MQKSNKMKNLFAIMFAMFIATTVSAQKPFVEWVNIPAGTFTMGSPASEPNRREDETQHKVTLSTFKMSKYEVTFDQYDAFCNATGNTKPDDRGWGRGKRPVINVSWDEATAFAKWMGCRLPTEAQWEYACRAGTTTAYNTGNSLSGDQANTDAYKISVQNNDVYTYEYDNRSTSDNYCRVTWKVYKNRSYITSFNFLYQYKNPYPTGYSDGFQYHSEDLGSIYYEHGEYSNMYIGSGDRKFRSLEALVDACAKDRFDREWGRRSGGSEEKSSDRTLPVGSFSPNNWGLYDMHGNVWEWCSDWYGDYQAVAQTNPQGPGTGSYRVLRGGSWYHNASYCRVSNRIFNHPVDRDNNSGFRLVRVS